MLGRQAAVVLAALALAALASADADTYAGHRQHVLQANLAMAGRGASPYAKVRPSHRPASRGCHCLRCKKRQRQRRSGTARSCCCWRGARTSMQAW